MGSFAPLFDSQLTSVSRSSWTYESLTNSRQLSLVIQTHLKQVYVFLCYSLIASAFGAYLHILWNIGGLLTTFATLGCMSWLLTTPPYEEPKRVSLSIAFSLLHGASVGPVIKLAVDVEPSILMRSFMGAVIIVACFLGFAMIARRTQYFYLGGLLSSSLSILLWIHFGSLIVGGSVDLFQFELYFGLLAFVWYMVVDTQEIIKKAHLGDLDYLKHTLTLLNGFIGVFVPTQFLLISLVFLLLLSSRVSFSSI